MENINIETTQNVLIDYKPAGISNRLLAYLIDMFLKITVYIGFLFVGIYAFSGSTSRTGNIIYFAGLFLIIICYDLYMETFFHGQSVGKMIMKIKVIKLDGSEATISSYLLRWLLAIVDITLTMGAGAIISIIVSKNGQRIGDMAENTTVVRIKRSADIDHSIFRDVDSGYKTIFPEVKKLSDSDISLVNELLDRYTRLDRPENLYITMNSAKFKLEKKMGIETTWEPYRFLFTLVKDYNNEFGRL